MSDPKHWRVALRDELDRASMRLMDFDERSALLMIEAVNALDVAHAVLDTFEAENQLLKEENAQALQAFTAIRAVAEVVGNAEGIVAICDQHLKELPAREGE
jgi:hypothetical protein